MMDLELVPFERVGEFVFESSIYSYNQYDFIYYEEDESTGWSRYSLENKGLDLFIEDGLITTIACSKYCFHKGKNLIGLSISEFCNLHKLSLNGREKDRLFMPGSEVYQDIYEFDELGLQIWSHEGDIVSVYCSPYEDD